jgi:hypothetical protein
MVFIGLVLHRTAGQNPIGADPVNGVSTPKQYTYSPVVRVTLVSLHATNYPASTIQFILSTKPMTFIPDKSNTGYGTFKGGGNNVSLVGTLVSSDAQRKDGVYVYTLDIPASWLVSAQKKTLLMCQLCAC